MPLRYRAICIPCVPRTYCAWRVVLCRFIPQHFATLRLYCPLPRPSLAVLPFPGGMLYTVALATAVSDDDVGSGDDDEVMIYLCTPYAALCSHSIYLRHSASLGLLRGGPRGADGKPTTFRYGLTPRLLHCRLAVPSACCGGAAVTTQHMNAGDGNTPGRRQRLVS